jgi:hypothetical protein
MSYKVEFLTSALSVDGSPEWRANAYRYRSATEASQHFAYLRGDGAPSIEHRVVEIDEPVNAAFEDGRSSLISA